MLLGRDRSPVAALALAACATACATTREPIDLTKLPGPADYPEAGAVVLLDEVRVDYHEEDGHAVADVTERQRVRLLREDGRDAIDVGIPYDRWLEEIRAVLVRTITPSGKVTEYSREQLDDVMAFPGFVLYADSRALVKDLSSLPVGSVVEVELTKRTREVKLFPFGQLFGGRAPTALSRLEVRTPAGWTISHVATENGARVDVAPSESVQPDGSIIRSFERRDIPAWAQEPHSPEIVDSLLRVLVRLERWSAGGTDHRGFADAGELSRYLGELAADTARPSPEIERLSRELTSGAPGPEEKARRLYSWVQENVRYVAVEVGIGGWKPHPAKEVFEVRYGDCKDKATLLKSLLAASGIESRLASINSHRGFPRPFGLPTLGTFNHAILQIDLPGGAVYADPTTRTVPFGDLPAADQEADVLPAGGMPIQKTPGSLPDKNTKHVSLRLQAAEVEKHGGDVKGTYRVEASGDLGKNLAHDLLTERGDDLESTIEGWLSIRSLNVESVRPVTGAGPGGTAAAEGALSVRGIPVSNTAPWLLRPSEIFDRPVPSLPPGPRKNPVVFPRRERTRVSLEVELPPGSAPPKLPETKTISGKYARYSLAFTEDGTKVKVERTFERTERIIPASEYSALKELYDAILSAEAAGVVIKPGV